MDDFLLIIGINVIEDFDHTLKIASQIKQIIDKLSGVNWFFKASFDKANRTSIKSYRGPNLDNGLQILKEIKETLKIKIITDVHESWQVEQVAQVVDMIQVPAFLCRQTDLYTELAKYNIPVHIKKGQFCSAEIMSHAVEKLKHYGFKNKVYLCERGTMFGYNDLVVDTRNLWKMQKYAPVTLDITHCLQQPGGESTGGLREFIPLMGRVAIASGVDGIFMEVHEKPEKALCDAATQFPLNDLEPFLRHLLNLRKAVGTCNENGGVIACIPARYGSSRLEGKPLLKIGNKSIIQRVYEQVKKIIDNVVILTDDSRIEDECLNFGGNVLCNNIECLNGTERIIKNLEFIGDYDIIVNVQGDEPFINPDHIKKCIVNYIARKEIDPLMVCSTLHHQLKFEEIGNSSIGKLILDGENNIMYCSRTAIPVGKNGKPIEGKNYYGHIGVFVYDRKYLEKEFAKENCYYQICEDIEWLKIIEQGYHVNSVLVDGAIGGIDTMDDYEKFKVGNDSNV